jgi:hypothetical protein
MYSGRKVPISHPEDMEAGTSEILVPSYHTPAMRTSNLTLGLYFPNILNKEVLSQTPWMSYNETMNC